MKGFLYSIGVLVLALLVGADSAFAEGGVSGYAAVGAGFAVAVAALGGALGQGRAVSAALDSIGRNPGAQGKLIMPMVLGLVFLETLVIFSFVIAFMLVGKVG